MRVTQRHQRLHECAAFLDGFPAAFCIEADSVAGYIICDLAELRPDTPRRRVQARECNTGRLVEVEIPTTAAWTALRVRGDQPVWIAGQVRIDAPATLRITRSRRVTGRPRSAPRARRGV